MLLLGYSLYRSSKRGDDPATAGAKGVVTLGLSWFVFWAVYGIIAGINMSRFVRNMDLFEFSQYTALGSQSFYISHAEPSYFQPMNTNFGIFPDLEIKHHNKQRKELYALRSLKAVEEMIEGGVLE